jgi:plasmid stabilization system protein ParE
MAKLRILPGAEADIEHALTVTLQKFGTAKYREYAGLIEESLEDLAENPRCGKARSDIHVDAWALHIGRPGRRARHLFLYRILEEGQLVEVLGLPYDSMDLPRQWPRR